MTRIVPIVYGSVYHIFNRGINSQNLFYENENYEYFLRQYDKYIPSIADTYAWCLMRNHFHILVRIKIPVIRGKMNLNNLRVPHQVFSNLFNSYAKAFNKKYSRHGSLFERPFKRKLIQDETYLKQVIYYIHNNPVNHKYCDHPIEYPWSSYITINSNDNANRFALKTLDLFEDVNDFKQFHRQKIDTSGIEKSLFKPDRTAKT